MWRLVDVHLRGERTRELIVLRAHTLTYAPLRKLADITNAADIQLWLIVHREHIPAAIAQLLEGLPHDTSDLERLLQCTPEHADDDNAEDLPAGAGRDFPYLEAIPAETGPRLYAAPSRDR